MPSEDFLLARAAYLRSIGKEHMIPLDTRLFDDNGEFVVRSNTGGGLSDPKHVARLEREYAALVQAGKV